MKRLIFDTNFLIDMARFKVGFDDVKDVVGAFEPWTIDLVVKELNGLATHKTKAAMHAKVALGLIEQGRIGVIKAAQKGADASIAKLADGGAMVATNDGALRKEIASKGQRVVFLRSKKKLEMA